MPSHGAGRLSPLCLWASSIPWENTNTAQQQQQPTSALVETIWDILSARLEGRSAQRQHALQFHTQGLMIHVSWASCPPSRVRHQKHGPTRDGWSLFPRGWYHTIIRAACCWPPTHTRLTGSSSRRQDHRKALRVAKDQAGQASNPLGWVPFDVVSC